MKHKHRSPYVVHVDYCPERDRHARITLTRDQEVFKDCGRYFLTSRGLGQCLRAIRTGTREMSRFALYVKLYPDVSVQIQTALLATRE